ncbi:hypothetical protein KBF38_15885 [bacterium]|nr:hypothetical protein [bacterium]
MSNNGFFSHYPFFTPPPESAQEAMDSTADGRAPGLPSADEAQPRTDSVSLRDCLIFPEGKVTEGGRVYLLRR